MRFYPVGSKDCFQTNLFFILHYTHYYHYSEVYLPALRTHLLVRRSDQSLQIHHLCLLVHSSLFCSVFSVLLLALSIISVVNYYLLVQPWVAVKLGFQIFFRSISHQRTLLSVSSVLTFVVLKLFFSFRFCLLKIIFFLFLKTFHQLPKLLSFRSILSNNTIITVSRPIFITFFLTKYISI